MRYYLIAGEASGDLHGANLMKALQREDPASQFRFWGGDLMEAVGGALQKHYRELAFMGFVEVLLNIRTILANFKKAKADIIAYQPDVLILIDYPGFNLRMAKWAKKKGIKVFYYISPQIWAWHSSRVHQIKANVDRMFVILPFEKAFYADYGMEVDYVGHPLVDVVQDHQTPSTLRAELMPVEAEKLVALLPGSRRQEIEKMLDVMLQVAHRRPQDQFVVAGAPSQPDTYYQELFQKYGMPRNVSLLSDRTYDLLKIADAALVTSGTATLETGLFRVPQVVCYKGSPLSYWIARRVINVKYIALVNLIMDKPVVKELIQADCNPEQLQQELDYLFQPQSREQLALDYQQLIEKLGDGGASQRCAQQMIANLEQG